MAAALFLGMGGCAPKRGGAHVTSAATVVPGYLAPGDVLKFTFPGAPELSQSQKIRADGKISMPMVGEITAGGKRLGDLQQELASRLKPQLQNSEVVISLESSTTPVYVGGAVAKPGRVVLDRPMTVLEAVMEAGGFSQGLANPSKVMLIRVEAGRHTTQVLDLSSSLKGRAADVFWLKPYDVIYVQESLF